ncbi:hypothetical protein GCM10027214_16960 [Stenotrophomonas tumulicola]
MSEEIQQINYTGTDLTSQDAIDFLKDMGSPSDLPCPICGHPDWGLSLTPGNGYFSALPTMTHGSTSPTPYFHGVYTTECMKCGYMRLHNLSRLAKWKKAGGSTGQEGQP